ncbi:hypothetical protein RhiirA5_353479 [Rhizophagus irregularis]|uniref:Uncharacterized protein n=1 Tax=Rhizophagus irregularis TaxID=588596 RepID=A0A2N0PYV6_9GLOM|nr:hypothetical protein RhiirA5_353479 [Rhizophagus irregularis]
MHLLVLRHLLRSLIIFTGVALRANSECNNSISSLAVNTLKSIFRFKVDLETVSPHLRY